MKKQQLYLSSIADDAPQTAKDYGLGLELAQFCTAAFLDSPEKAGELFPQDCARDLTASLAACLSSSDRFVLHGPFMPTRQEMEEKHGADVFYQDAVNNTFPVALVAHH